MELEEQIILIRAAYHKLLAKFMSETFMRKAALFSHLYPKKMNDTMEQFYQLSSLIENALLRGETSRALLHLSVFAWCLQEMKNRVDKQCSEICVKHHIAQ